MNGNHIYELSISHPFNQLMEQGCESLLDSFHLVRINLFGQYPF